MDALRLTDDEDDELRAWAAFAEHGELTEGERGRVNELALRGLLREAALEELRADGTLVPCWRTEEHRRPDGRGGWGRARSGWWGDS